MLLKLMLKLKNISLLFILLSLRLLLLYSQDGNQNNSILTDKHFCWVSFPKKTILDLHTALVLKVDEEQQNNLLPSNSFAGQTEIDVTWETQGCLPLERHLCFQHYPCSSEH